MQQVGTYEDKLAGTRVIREQVKNKIEEWINEFIFKVEEEE